MTSRDIARSTGREAPDILAATPVESGALGRAARHGVAWVAVQTWTVKATGAITFVIVSRQLQPSQFGLVALAVATIAIISLLNERGFVNLLIRKADISTSVIYTVFWFGLGLASVLTGVTWVLAAPLSSALGQPDLAAVLRWLAIGFVLSALAAVPDALLRRALKFKLLAIRGTSSTCISSLIGITLAIGGAGVWALVAQQLAYMVVGVLLVWMLTRWRIRATFDVRVLREVMGFAGRFTIIDVLTTAYDRGEDLLISVILGSPALGSWAVAGRLVRLLQESGATVINAVAIPTFSRLQHDASQLHRGYALATSATGLLLFPAFLFLAVTSPDLVPWILGQQWAASGAVAQALALAAALGLLNYFDRNIFIAINRLTPELITMIAVTASHLLVILAVARHGLTVISIAILARVLITVPVRLVLVNRFARVPFSAMSSALRICASSMIAAAGALATKELLSGAVMALQICGSFLAMVLVYFVAIAAVARGPVMDLWSAMRSDSSNASPISPGSSRRRKRSWNPTGTQEARS